jgi:hypothetical protein
LPCGDGGLGNIRCGRLGVRCGLRHWHGFSGPSLDRLSYGRFWEVGPGRLGTRAIRDIHCRLVGFSLGVGRAGRAQDRDRTNPLGQPRRRVNPRWVVQQPASRSWRTDAAVADRQKPRTNAYKIFFYRSLSGVFPAKVSTPKRRYIGESE